MRQKGFAPILILIFVIVVGAAAYYVGTLNSKKPIYPQFLPQPTQTSNATPNSGNPRSTSTPSSAWNTYTNTVRGYTIKYPPGWDLDISKAETPLEAAEGATLIISMADYKLTIYWPSAFGPGVCIFDDQPHDPLPEMTTRCQGQYVTLTNLDGRQIRRLTAPQTVAGHAQWQVYTKHNDNYATLPPTTYIAPLNYDSSKIDTMDKILSSFKSSN